MSNLYLDQSQAPLFDGLKDYLKTDWLQLYVPGHRGGAYMDKDFVDYIGRQVVGLDLAMMPFVDGPQHPQTFMKRSLELAADLWGSQRCFFCVQGTSGAIQVMTMSVLEQGDKIIIPRNVHKSVMAGIIMVDAVPVYMDPIIDPVLGISHGISPQVVERTLEENPDAKAVLILNPTYYGVATDVRAIAEIVHRHGIPLLVDEAHGGHFRFCDQLPDDSISCGADMVCQSTHKILGSLSQSSMLHVQGELVDYDHVGRVLDMMQTTSPSYILMCSLDTARRNMALHGQELWSRTVELYRETRRRVNKIPGLFSFDIEHLRKTGDYLSHDPTRLTVCLRELGLTGNEVRSRLASEYHIQMELDDYYNVLAVGTPGDTPESCERLLNALRDIATKARSQPQQKNVSIDMPKRPIAAISPSSAFFGKLTPVPLENSVGRISGEFVMAYPPGIPILCPGELIDRDLLNYIRQLIDAHMNVIGPKDQTLGTILVCERHSAGKQP